MFCFAQSRSETVLFCLDKQVYDSYDTLSVSGLLIAPDAATYSELSRYCLVELFSEQDTILERQKVRCEGAAFHARFKLGDIREHRYLMVRVYTQFMRNFPERLWPVEVAGVTGQMQVPVIKERKPIEKGSLQVALSKGVLVYKYVTKEPTDEIYQLDFYAGGQKLGSRTLRNGEDEGNLVPDSIPGDLICGIVTDARDEIVASRFFSRKRETSPSLVQIGPSVYAPKELISFTLKGQECDLSLLIRIEKDEEQEETSRLIPETMRRFMAIGGTDFGHLLTGQYACGHLPEQVLALCGAVKTENGKPYTGEGTLLAFNNETGHTYENDIDQDGSFAVGTDDFKNGDSFFLQVYDKKKKSGYHRIEVEDASLSVMELPQIDLIMPFTNTQTYQQQGMDTTRVHMLPEVKISVPFKTDYTNSVKFYRNNYLEWSDIKENNYTELEYILRAMSGIKIVDGWPCSIRGASTFDGVKPLPIRIDGYWVEVKDITDKSKPLQSVVTVSDIASIEYIPAVRAFACYGMKAFDGVIVIKTRTGREQSTVESKGIHYTPLGLSDNRPFLPHVPLCSLMLGKAETREVLFEAPVLPGKYRIVLEGIGPNLTIVHQVLKFEVK